MSIFAMQMKKTENPLQQGVLPCFLFKGDFYKLNP